MYRYTRTGTSLQSKYIPRSTICGTIIRTCGTIIPYMKNKKLGPTTILYKATAVTSLTRVSTFSHTKYIIHIVFHHVRYNHIPYIRKTKLGPTNHYYSCHLTHQRISLLSHRLLRQNVQICSKSQHKMQNTTK